MSGEMELGKKSKREDNPNEIKTKGCSMQSESTQKNSEKMANKK